MEFITPAAFLYFARCLEGFFFGTISVNLSPPKLLKLPNIPPIPNLTGLFSGIFAMYLGHHGSRQSIDKEKKILFYALWVCYVLYLRLPILLNY